MKYFLSEKLNGVDPKFIKEVFEYSASERRGITMEKKKIARTAAIVAALAAVLGISVAAAGFGGLFKLSGYIGEKNVSQKIPEALRDSNVDSKVTELSPEGELLPGEARFESVVAGKWALFATFELNFNDAEFITEDEKMLDGFYQFENVMIYGIDENGEKYLGSGAGISGPTPLSCENGVMTFVLRGGIHGGLPDTIGISWDGIEHFTFKDGESIGVSYHPGEIRVSSEDYTVLSTYVCKEPQTLGGHEYILEADGCGMILYTEDKLTPEEHVELNNERLFNADITLTLKDGTVVVDNPMGLSKMGPEYLTMTHIIGGSGTVSDGSRFGISYEFTSVFDIAQIESVEIEGMRFEIEEE